MIFSVLWLLQTVFLQSFYNLMLIYNTRSSAQSIIDNAGSEDISEMIDDIARENSLLIYITDTNGEPLYISDEYKNTHGRKKYGKNIIHNEKDNSKNENVTGYRSLPDDFDSFLQTLSGNDSGTAEYKDDNSYVYGAYIDYCGEEEKCVLYISTLLDPVGSAVNIIRVQLAIVTVFSLAIGFALAWIMARRFSKPVLQLSDKAHTLGSNGYCEDFNKGFCAELDELSDTLDKTDKKLRESKTFQNELLANVSHDLRTPLTMIKGFAEEVGEYSWSDEEQRKSDIGIIIREADRLTALVNEILEYSELQSLDNTADFDEVDISALVNRIAENFDSLYKRDGYAIKREIESGLCINGSAPRLERAVCNLIDNAVRHTGDSKNITIRVKSENGVRVEIIDSGEGIDEEILPHIWEKYYTSRQRQGKGVSGLGLAIVRQIAVMHGAQYGVISRKGEGSTFYLVFNEQS